MYFYVLEGKGIVEIGNEQEKCTKMNLLKAQQRFHIDNESKRIYSASCSEVPRPTEQTRVL